LSDLIKKPAARIACIFIPQNYGISRGVTASRRAVTASSEALKTIGQICRADITRPFFASSSRNSLIGGKTS
jgi:hypothetical protein